MTDSVSRPIGWRRGERAEPRRGSTCGIAAGVRERSLTTEHAEVVGAHPDGRSVVDIDPELAYARGAARRRVPGCRSPVRRPANRVRRGDYLTALHEFRALGGTGGDEYLPAMADCERALGRHQAALKLVKEGLSLDPEVAQHVELKLVEAGVRIDTGRSSEALRLLKHEIESIGARGPKLARARLRYAYADLLERSGDPDQAERWFDAVVRLDPDDNTDAADRVAALRGIVIDYDETDEFEQIEADAQDEAEANESPAEGADAAPVQEPSGS